MSTHNICFSSRNKKKNIDTFLVFLPYKELWKLNLNLINRISQLYLSQVGKLLSPVAGLKDRRGWVGPICADGQE